MKKSVSFIIIIIIIMSICACGNDNETSSDTGSSEISGTSSNEDGGYGYELTVKNMNGRIFRVLCQYWGKDSQSILGFGGEIIQAEDFDETTANIVDVAKYQTRKLVEEEYNCKIEGDLVAGDLNTIIRNSILGNIDDKYDIWFDSIGNIQMLVPDGYLVNMSEISTINFENPWWDQSARKDLSLMDKLYWMAGDINTYDNDGTWVMLYNKELLNVYHPDINIYDIVKNQEWTFEKFKELTKDVTRDTNNDGILDEMDMWGYCTESYNVYIHLIGQGKRLTEKDEDDIPHYIYQEEAVVTSLQKIIEFYNDGSNVLVANAEPYISKYPSNTTEMTTIKAFTEGRALFFSCGLINLTGFRDLDFEYGILPIPKGSKNQDNYKHTVSRGNSSVMAIPDTQKSIRDYDDLGIIIEAIGAESKNIVTPIYYEKSLKTKDASSDNDELMLDIIFENRCFDLAVVFNWGNILTDITAMDPNIVSRFQGNASIADSDMQSTLEAFR